MNALALAGADPVLRPATPGDVICVWRWNSAPEVRAMSRDPRPIALADHRAWYSARVASPDPMWIIEDGCVPLGVVRIDRRDGGAWISIALAAAARGRGIGRLAITQACRQVRTSVLAEIRTTNLASIACFTACGFSPLSSDGDLAVYRWRP